MAARNAERQKLAGQLTERRAALDAIDLDALEIRDEVLRALADKLGKCRDAVQRRDLARAAEARARAEAAMAARQRDEAASKLKIAGQVHTRKSDERAETARMADLAEATLSEHAASLRTHLVEGAPCPVCGADEHPFVAENSAAAKLVARGASAPLGDRCGSEGGRGRYFGRQRDSDEGDQRVRRGGESDGGGSSQGDSTLWRRSRHFCPRYGASSRGWDWRPHSMLIPKPLAICGSGIRND